MQKKKLLGLGSVPESKRKEISGCRSERKRLGGKGHYSKTRVLWEQSEHLSHFNRMSYRILQVQDNEGEDEVCPEKQQP